MKFVDHLPDILAHLPAVLIAYAGGSNCTRRQVACILASHSGDILATAYNGSRYPQGCQRPEEQGNCGCLHAEERAAMLYKSQWAPMHVFVSAAPCERCAKVLCEIGAKNIYYAEDSRPQQEGFDIFERAGVNVAKIHPSLFGKQLESADTP